MTSKHRAVLIAAAPYLLICLALLALFIMFGRQPAVRVGDGAEYYAMYYGWDVSHRPWMDPQSYAAYDRALASNLVEGLVPKAWFDAAFSQLQIGVTNDYNHFWFYSLLAVMTAKLAGLVGFKLGVHASFIALHYLILSATAALAYRYYRWTGVAIIALMTLFSPLLWFVTKAHTEVFTVCLVLGCVMLMQQKRYMAAALCLALASTQNPSFALVACVPLAYRALLERSKTYTFWEVVMLVSTVLAVLIHPTYYFFRYGVVTPQLLAGGASLGGNLSTFYVWLLDPDLGLLPNWPLGLLSLMAVLLVGGWRRMKGKVAATPADPAWLGFVVVYLMVNFYAHSSTTNFNSGATPGLARYALWYLPLAFPYFYSAALVCRRHRASWYAMLSVVTVVSVMTAYAYDPRTPEQYTRPAPLSYFIQSKLPGWYTPPAEVFLERYSGRGEGGGFGLVVGPDCRKLLMVSGPGRKEAAAPAECQFDPAKLITMLRASEPIPKSHRFHTLTEAEASSMVVSIAAGSYSASAGGSGTFLLGQGWGQQESWGVWSVEANATLQLPCNDKQFFAPTEPFALSMTLQPYGKQTLTVRGGDTVLWKGEMQPSGTKVDLKVPASNCRQGSSVLSLAISNPQSPQERGESADFRKLGVGLREFELAPVR